jgi:dTDP-4-amino-4,6-dideoxygalactose transaminase
MHDPREENHASSQSGEFEKTVVSGTSSAIPLTRPFRTGRELEYVQAAMESDMHVGDGPFTRRCHALLEARLGVDRALLTTSCTTALEMAALLARRGEPGTDAGDVICPAYGFSSTAGAFHLHGYTPVFVDVRPDTLNLDERAVEAHITPRTRVIVALHYAGVPCEMDALRALAAKHDLVLVEDAAQAIFSSYHGSPAGSLGDFAAFSFHGTKNLSCGEGGALTFRDGARAIRAEILREKGTNRNQFVRGIVDKYTWVDLGGSYLPSDLLAAYLLAQLEGEARIHALRKERYERYMAGLRRLADAGVLQLPSIPDRVESNYHLFHVVLDSSDVRDRLSARLRAEGITATFHYAALHLTPMGRRFGPAEGALPVSEHVATTLLRLPLYPDLALPDVDRVIDAVERFFVPVARRQRQCAI